jgi:hypothetical protein
MICIPVTPLISLITLANCTFMVVSAFCICCTVRPTSSTSRFRCRHSVRNSRISSGGRNEFRSSP